MRYHVPMKRILPVLFLMVLLVAVGEGLYLWQPGLFSFLEKQPVTPLSLTEEDTAPSVQELSETSLYYDIDASYPSKTPLKTSVNAATDAKAVQILKSFLENEISRFKETEEFETLTEERAALEGYTDGRKKQLKIEYDEYQSKTTVSYVFTVYLDTFGAHGNTYFRTFSFDTTTGEGIVLADLFGKDAAYLDTLTALSREKLSEKLGASADPQMIDQGTTAYEDNFQTWYLTDDALVLLFPPYQVAAYAAGPQTVRIPFTELRDILK